MIPAGAFSFHEAGGATSCRSLHVDLFVDVNDSGVYDAPPTDHAWRLYVFAWEDDNDMKLTFTFTLDPDSCTFRKDGTQSICKYFDIEWPLR